MSFLFEFLRVCDGKEPPTVPYSDCDGALIADVHSQCHMQSEVRRRVADTALWGPGDVKERWSVISTH